MDVRCYIHLLLLLTRHLVLSKNSDIPQFGQPINNVTVPSGREGILECIVENLATYKVAWLRVDTQTILTIHSHVITKNHRIGVTHSDRRIWHLHIRDVKESDRGWYMCQINTDPMKSQVGYLEVVVPPDITDYQTSRDTITMEGENVTFGCAATGSPTPNITWRKEAGSIIVNEGKEVPSVDGSELNLMRVTRLHMGAYLCIASNGIPPTVSKRIMLIVHFPPAIWIKDQMVGVQVGQSALLECNSEAYPKTVCYWSKQNGDVVYPGPKYETEVIDNGYKTLMKLTLKIVEEEDFGFYKCVVKNKMGEADGNIKLYEIPKPSTTTTTTLAPVTTRYTIPSPTPITTIAYPRNVPGEKTATRLKGNNWNERDNINRYKPYQNEILDSEDDRDRKPVKVVAAGSSKKTERITRSKASSNRAWPQSHITKLLFAIVATLLSILLPL